MGKSKAKIFPETLKLKLSNEAVAQAEKDRSVWQ
jgi:hypothetical protein